MNDQPDPEAIEMIPIDRVTVINPRVRNKRVFAEIVSNISEIGLKRPITVTRRLRVRLRGAQPNTVSEN